MRYPIFRQTQMVGFVCHKFGLIIDDFSCFKIIWFLKKVVNGDIQYSMNFTGCFGNSCPSTLGIELVLWDVEFHDWGRCNSVADFKLLTTLWWKWFCLSRTLIHPKLGWFSNSFALLVMPCLFPGLTICQWFAHHLSPFVFQSKLIIHIWGFPEMGVPNNGWNGVFHGNPI